MRISTGWRARWAALGAAVAVSLGAGGVFLVNAASTESSVVMVTPVRILDTRDPLDVGLAGPFVSALGQDLQVTGPVATTSGLATVVPAGATGVILNVTVVAPTANGYLSVRPADAPGAPTTSNLNFLAGQSVPNAVTVQLPTSGPDAGRIEITYDAYGVGGPRTDALIDVVGYTIGTAVATDSRVTALESQVASLQNQVVRAAHSEGEESVTLTSLTDKVIRSVTVVPTANGKVIANASGAILRTTDSEFRGRCSITSGTSVADASAIYVVVPASGVVVARRDFAGTRGFDVVKDVPFTVRLVCDREVGSGGIAGSSLTAVFAPN